MRAMLPVGLASQASLFAPLRIPSDNFREREKPCQWLLVLMAPMKPPRSTPVYLGIPIAGKPHQEEAVGFKIGLWASKDWTATTERSTWGCLGLIQQLTWQEEEEKQTQKDDARRAGDIILLFKMRPGVSQSTGAKPPNLSLFELPFLPISFP